MGVLTVNENTAKPDGDGYSTLEGTKTLVDHSERVLTASNTTFLSNNDIWSSIGWNDEMNTLTIRPECEPTADSSLREMYRCVSAMQLM
jgi:hypothetical protein